MGEIIVTPNPKFGEPSTWRSLESFKAAVADGTLHLWMQNLELQMALVVD